jgi:phosphate transport system substrate-binding protein
VLLFCSALAGADELRIGGTGNALGSMRVLGDAFAKEHPGAKIVILNSIGSSGAIKAVPKAAIEIGVTARPLSEEEKAGGIHAVEYARSPTVFTVQEKNRVAGLTRSQIADVYTGKLAAWPDGTLVRPILRQPGDDNTRQISGLSAEIAAALGVAERRPGLNFAVTDQEAADKNESIPGSLGVTTLALIRSERRALRALAIDGVEPSLENARSGRYPILKHFYLILPNDPPKATQEFVKFVLSARGGEILKQLGHILP